MYGRRAPRKMRNLSAHIWTRSATEKGFGPASGRHVKWRPNAGPSGHEAEVTRDQMTAIPHGPPWPPNANGFRTNGWCFSTNVNVPLSLTANT
jgi:hypothetical protein